ncbi:MAG: hypothetical protein M0R30_05475 [Methanoregula sp.]|jgi:hypothetical protein|uniref:hypothetical protein n=1 Tax=Methanoregula sp. TaxID=2052170 RepID=UPI0025F3A819|nr:hypothetical protein [Methanoregula sp.]MCK9631075.1 hypothetical protein [Methanoregula sp.]
MSPDSEKPAARDLETIDHFFDNWCNLPWTEWVPFNATKQVFTKIPQEPGIYRIRPVGKECLVYIGETKRSLRERLHNLIIELAKAEGMPWSDPHTEAPALWAWRTEWLSNHEVEKNPKNSMSSERSSDIVDDKSQQDSMSSDRSSDIVDDKSQQDSMSSEGPSGREDEKNSKNSSSGEGLADHTEEALLPVDPHGFECSAAPLDASDSGRRAMESFLLYRYRQENGESPLCSLGRFHPRYRRSTTRKEGVRGARLAEGQKDNPAGRPGHPPLRPSGTPGDRDWMGLAWSEHETLTEEKLRNVPRSPGLYLLLGAGQVISIGGVGDCAARLNGQAGRSWEGMVPQFSYHVLDEPIPPHQLRELETDLIGNFYEQFRKAPELQFRSSSHRP